MRIEGKPVRVTSEGCDRSEASLPLLSKAKTEIPLKVLRGGGGGNYLERWCGGRWVPPPSTES